MQRERLTWAMLLIAVLLTGWLMGRLWRPDDGHALSDATTFRAWFWEHRTFDLLAQVGLIFAGALGVAALLPSRSELHTTGSPPLPSDEDPYVPLA